MKKLLLGIPAAIAVAGLLGAVLIFKVSPETNVESIGYQYAVREDISNLSNRISAAGYTSLNPQSLFSGRVRVKKLAESVIVGQVTDLGKAEALIEWVQLHVRPQTSAPTTIITDDYVNIIKRGWGYCDQMAHVFATMATYVGLEAKQLQLFRNDGVSPHTLAMIKIEGKWRIASTWRGVIPKNSSGEPYTKTGFIHRLEKGDIYGLAPIGSTEFENSKSLETFPYIGNWQTVKKISNRLINKILSATATTTTTDVSNSASELANRTQVPINDLKLYNIARDAHLDLDFSKARDMYIQLVQTSRSDIIKDEARFALGMAFFDASDYDAALISFSGIIQDYPFSAWLISAKRMKAETLIKMGKIQESLNILDSIGTVQSNVRASVIRGKPM